MAVESTFPPPLNFWWWLARNVGLSFLYAKAREMRAHGDPQIPLSFASKQPFGFWQKTSSRFSANCTGQRFALVKAQVWIAMPAITLWKISILICPQTWRALTIPPASQLQDKKRKNVLFGCWMA
jgi:hypothetical protein